MILRGVIFLAGLGLFFCLGFSAQAAIADHLVINELATADDSTYDDWVELYNPTATDVDLSGFSLQKVTSGGSVTRTDLGGVVPAGGYFLVVRNDASTLQSLKDEADQLGGNFALADNNALYLVESNSNIDPAAPGAEVIDAVGWGGVTYGEGISFADNIGAGKSLSRTTDGDDTDDNSVDFIILDAPTRQNSGIDNGSGGDLSGDVLVTIYPNVDPVQNITADSASIVFEANTDGAVTVEYGTSDAYGSISTSQVITANTESTVILDALECNTTYHYKINVENSDATDSDSTEDANFTTLPCGGITVDNIAMTRSGARANDDYNEGWEWQFDVTVWNELETELGMKFAVWNGADSIQSGGNVRFSVDGGVTWVDIESNDTYPTTGADISSLDEDTTQAGRQVSIIVQMKVPAGTLAGAYSTSYGIVTEEAGL